ncbi:MAG TPA: glutamate-1-semialdehyde 2,1-aminomutase [Candidatus Elarobacter sp.]|nr:glutamate-1-semialdehyde 2,1-aminomutase [Candidatus Elarobacter sp.]
MTDVAKTGNPDVDAAVAAEPVRRAGSEAAFAAAKRVIPGGVNSTVRAFKAVGGTPVFVREAKGAYLVDVDGNRYLDYVLSWGPMIAGHAHPAVVEALQRAAERGSSYGTPTEYETELAELIVAAVPSVEKVRFCSSGTEATANAVRLARGFTGRDKFVKFEGCYHGSADPFLIAAGSSALTMGVPNSKGVPAATARDTIIVPYNDAAAVRAAFEANPGEIAAVIVEPYVGNMGLVLPQPGFLRALRVLTREFGALLIFDEVMTGFRVARGGVQAREGVLPDLTTLGKVIGGGLPVGAFGGTAEIMDRLTPDGDVFQAGTLSGNPLAMAAGIATLRLLSDDSFVRLEALGQRMMDGMAEVFRRHGVPHTVAAAGSMVGFFFADGPVTDLASAKRADTELYARFFHAMLDRGFYFAPSQFEAGFLSLAHTEAEIGRTIDAADDALTSILRQAQDDMVAGRGAGCR